MDVTHVCAHTYLKQMCPILAIHMTVHIGSACLCLRAWCYALSVAWAFEHAQEFFEDETGRLEMQSVIYGNI